MKNGWETRRFGDVCEFEKESGEWKNLPYVGLEDIESNSGRFLGTTSPLPVKSMTFRFTPEHVLYGRLRPYLNKVLLPDFEGHCSTEIFPIRTSDELDKRYLFHWLRSEEIVSKINATWTGARMPRANMNQVLDFPIPVPPIEEQRRIVAILDEAFSCIDKATSNTEKNIQNARELFDSYLNNIFSNPGPDWITQKLGDVGQITSSKRIYKSEYVSNGIPFYRTKEIKELANGKEITTELFISEMRYQEIKSTFGVPQRGEILMTAIGTIGEIWVVNGREPFYFKDGNVLWLKNFTDFEPNYLKYALTSFVEQIQRLSRGAAYNALPIQKLNSYEVAIPPIHQQHTIVEWLLATWAAARRLNSVGRRRLAELERLKKSILQKAFSGEIIS